MKTMKQSVKKSVKRKPVQLTGRRLKAYKVIWMTAERTWDRKDEISGPIRPYPDQLAGKIIKRRYYKSSGESPVHGHMIRPDEYMSAAHVGPNRLDREYVPARKPKRHGATALTAILNQVKSLEKLRNCSTSLKF